MDDSCKIELEVAIKDILFTLNFDVTVRYNDAEFKSIVINDRKAKIFWSYSYKKDLDIVWYNKCWHVGNKTYKEQKDISIEELIKELNEFYE